MDKIKLLVTGTAGFILGNFLRHVSNYKELKEAYEVRSFDRIKDVSYLFDNFQKEGQGFFIGDICDKHCLSMIMRSSPPDIVIHGAASTFVDDSIVSADEFIRTNIQGTQNIIDNCVLLKSKLLYFSTDEVMGALNEGDQPFTETSPLNPRNPYASSKGDGELLIKAAAETHGLKYTIIRPSNNFGPRQSSEKFIPKILKCIFSNKQIPIYGEGLQMREWTYVTDTCKAVCCILNSWKDNETYNISSGNEIRNIDLVDKILEITKGSKDLKTFVQDRKGHDFRYSVDSSKIKKLGWSPSVSFEEGLVKTIQWYSINQHFLNR
jgi:dTDP-glucose 4,6-dehydratase